MNIIRSFFDAIAATTGSPGKVDKPSAKEACRQIIGKINDRTYLLPVEIKEIIEIANAGYRA